VATRLDPEVSSRDLWARVRAVRVGARWYGLVLGILALVVGPTAVIVALTAEPAPDAPGASKLVVFLVVFFVFQLLTSGTEEIGWRGYLNEKLRRGRNFWDTGWAVGLPWAIWHWPIVVILFVQQEMVPAAILGSLAGFSLGIVAASILHAWFYERTGSVFLNMFIHAIFNTIPLTLALLFRDSPAAVIANLALWAVVIFLKRQHDKPDATEVVQPSAMASQRP
jgi:membrane protease YdiL (CAAX protease family)